MSRVRRGISNGDAAPKNRQAQQGAMVVIFIDLPRPFPPQFTEKHVHVARRGVRRVASKSVKVGVCVREGEGKKEHIVINLQLYNDYRILVRFLDFHVVNESSYL